MKNDLTGVDRAELTRNDLTDGIVDILLLKHRSKDDSPSTGDGVGITWSLEESTYNTEFDAASLDILSTDITNAQEDIDWKFNTMINGTLSEFLHVDADGGFIIKLSPFVVQTDDPTTEIRIHNTATDGDPYLSWALGTAGSPDIKWALGVDDGDNDNWKLYSEDWQGSGVELVEVSAGLVGLFKHFQGMEIETDSAAARTALLIDNNDTDQIALELEAANITADVIQVTADTLTNSFVMDVTADALTSGGIFNLVSDNNDATARTLVNIVNDNTGATGAVVLGIDQDANANAVEITTDATSDTGIQLLADSLNTGTGLDLSADALTSGLGVNLTSSSTNLTGSGRLLSVEGSGDFNDATGILAEIKSIHTTGTGFQLSMDAVTDGNGILLSADALTSGTGAEFRADTVSITSGEILEVIRDVTGTLAAKTGNLISFDDITTHDNDSDVTLNFDVVEIIRDHTRNTGGADTSTTTNQGSVLSLQNTITETTGTITDSVDVLKIIQDTNSTGNSIDIDHNPQTSEAITIDAENTTADVIAIAADALTAGSILDLTSDVNDGTTRNLVRILNNNTGATNAVPLKLENNASSHDFELENVDAGTEGVVINTHHNSASPDVDDIITSLEFNGEDSGGTETEYAKEEIIIADETDGSEEGRVIRYTAQLDGTSTETFREEIGDLKPIRNNSQSYEWFEDFDTMLSGTQFESGDPNDFWTLGGTNHLAANQTYTERQSGEVQAVTSGADDDSEWAVGASIFRVDANPILETRFKVTDISNVYISAGFAEGSFNDKTAPDDDIALVGIDSDNGHAYGADQIVFFSNDNNAGLVTDDCGVAISADTFITIRIDLTDTEQPRIFVNNSGGQITAADEVAAGNISGTVQAGISVGVYFMVQSLSAAADTFTIDYIKSWQDR